MPSAIAKGRIASMDLAAGGAAPGVIAIVTAQNAGKLGKGNFNTALLLGGPNIQHYHQAIALVVAETYEQARRGPPGRACVRAGEGRGELAAMRDSAKPADSFGSAAESSLGDFAGAFAAAPVKLDASYTTAHESHSMMEPHATIAAWMATTHALDRKPDDRVERGGHGEDARHPEGEGALMSPYIGGGFGGKLWIRADALLAALGARAARRPVKVVLERAIMPNNTVHRSATLQRIRIGATKDGKITAIAHESWSADLPGGKPEAAAVQTRSLYAGPNRMTANRLVALDLPEHNAMRPQRSARPGGAGDRDRRDGREARHGSGRVPHRERHAGRAGQSTGQAAIGRSAVQGGRAEAEARSASAVFAAATRGVPAPGRPAIRLGQAQRAARPRATGAGSSAWAWPRPIATTS